MMLCICFLLWVGLTAMLADEAVSPMSTSESMEPKLEETLAVGIAIECSYDFVRIKWQIPKELVPYAARFFLGSCMASNMTVLPSGEGDASFNYPFSDCKFKREMKGKHLMFQNELTYRPDARSKPPAFHYGFKCVYKRPEGWVPPFLNPGSGVSEGHGGLIFYMVLLNDKLEIATTNVIPLGSYIPIWASVEQEAHQPLLLLLDECVAATTAELRPDSQVHYIIGNKGCLLESKTGHSRFLPRYHSSSLTLYLQSFRYGVGEEVYIHCTLVAWDPQVLDENKKACHYDKTYGRWELLDNPFWSSVCSCCDSSCKSRMKRDAEWEPSGLTYKSVLGPLIIVDGSDSVPNMSVNADSA
ncbi:uncharacterized protein LOC117521888 [Thalassophryne amazonica]|uniref:uncharacterized protein LOC117521888 n=1 Tax=Thalassophryne amazonica TaxID=390379 RepID=UPI001470B03A|nr:uncharacterized protein LOC117521888 [Thalassophryne amazonica]